MEPEGDEDAGVRASWSVRADWAGLSMFVLAVGVALAVLVIVTAEAFSDAPNGGSGVIASAITGVIGAMIGAVSTFAGGGGFSRPAGRHVREREDADL